MEKRRFSRVTFSVRAKLLVDGSEYAVDSLVNLSVGGCLLEVAAPGIVADSDCTLTLLLPWMAPGVEIFGRVRRADDGELSIQFTRIEPENLFHLHNIVRYNAPDPDQIEEEIQARRGLL